MHHSNTVSGGRRDHLFQASSSRHNEEDEEEDDGRFRGGRGGGGGGGGPRRLEVPRPASRERRGGSLSPRFEDSARLRRSVSSSRVSTNGGESLNVVPEAKSPYNGLTHGVRRMVPAELACKMGCRGPRCKYDRSDEWTDQQMAIKGLYSHW